MTAPVVAVAFGDGEYLAIPASGHALVLVTDCVLGGQMAVCFCGQVRLADTAEAAVEQLDAHIAEAVTAGPDVVSDTERAEILAWLNAEPRSFTDILGRLWCATVTETGGKPDEVELLDGSRLVLAGGVWVPKGGA